MVSIRKVFGKWLVCLVWVISAICFCPEHSAFAFSGCASVGDLMYEVVANCGEPTSVQSRQEEMTGAGFVPYHVPDGWVRGPLIITTIEYWIYNLGPTRFMVILRFENGILRSINTAGYGY